MWWLDPGKEVLNVLFNRILAPYVENLDLNQVNYGIGQGQLTLRNLRLKKGALDKFQLPVDVLEGYLGKFTLSLHWMNLGNQPVEILVEDVYLLVVPSPTNTDPEEEDQRAQAAKAERLQNAELLHVKGQAESSTDTTQSQGLWDSLIAKIINNVQVTVKNIHVRYEDKISVPGHPFAAGLSLAAFTAISVDEKWQATFIESTAGEIHKLAKLESLAIYFDTDTQSVSGLSMAETSKILHSDNHQYILKPVSGEGRVIVNHKTSQHTPRFDVQLIFDEIGVAMDNAQYCDVISLVDMYHVYRRQHQYRKYQPSEEELSVNPARARLLFAGRCILANVHERNEKWTWKYFAERRDDRNRYVDLFQKKILYPQALIGPDKDAFDALEKKLSYEDIRFYRSIARSRLRKDEVLRQRLETEKQRQQVQKQSWGSWLWGSSGNNKPSEDSAFTGTMTDEQRKQLYDVLDYDEKTALAESLKAPRDSQKICITAKLRKGSLALKTDPHGDVKDMMLLVFDIFQATFIQRPDNMEASISLNGFRVFDGTTPDTLYPQIVHVKSRTELPGNELSGVHEADAENSPFFFVQFEQNPLDQRADSALTVRLRHMEVIYHKGYVEAVYKFFRPPASQLESVEALLNAASQTLEGLRKETRAGLEYALQTHKTIDVQMDMDAPVIIIPENITTNECKHLIIDAGHIAIESNLVNKDAIRTVQQKRNQAYTEDDYKRLESLMYDKLALRLTDAQFILGDNLLACREALSSDSQDSLHLLERINVELQVEKSIVPTALNIAQFRVSGNLPSLQVNFSDTKYKSLMRLVDVCIPKFENSQLNTSHPHDDKAGFQLPASIFGPTGTEYNIEDDQAVEVDDEAGDEQFFEAEDGPESGGIQQHTFDLYFEVGNLRASISKTGSDNTDKLLGDVCLERFSLRLSLTQYELKVITKLRSIVMHVVNPGADKTPFISSPTTSSADEDLLSVTYYRVQSDSPDFLVKYEGFEQTVDAKISTLMFRAAPQPVLAIYDFIITTFSPDTVDIVHIDEENSIQQPLGSGDTSRSNQSKTRIVVNLESIQVMLVSEMTNLATLSLSTADVNIILHKNSIRVAGRLGNLALANNNRIHVIREEFNQILSIEGSNFADFLYESHENDDNVHNGVQSSFSLNAASVKVHFLEQPFHDIYLFIMRFAKLKGVYDAATEAAVQTASGINLLQFKISIKTPILVFPCEPATSQDALIMRLGEIEAYNSSEALVNKTTASLRGVQLISCLHHEGPPSTLKIVDDIDLMTDIIQTSGINRDEDREYPDTQVTVKISDVRLQLTQVQYSILVILLQSIPGVFTGPPDSYEIPGSDAMQTSNSYQVLDVKQQIRIPDNSSHDFNHRNWTSVDLVLTVNTVKLHLYDDSVFFDTQLKEHGIARFALNGNTLRFKLMSNGNLEAQVISRSFTMSNTKPGNNKFREIIPAAHHDRNQFMLLYTSSQGPSSSSLAILTVDSPHIIFAIDPIFSLLDFFTSTNQSASPPLETHSAGNATADSRPQSFDFRVDLHDVSISVLENDADAESQAIRLYINQLSVAQQGIFALTVNHLGMSLLRMGKDAESVRFLDDLDFTATLDSRSSASQQTTSIEMTSKPIVIRASYRDIMLITSIMEKAIELYGSSSSKTPGSRNNLKNVTIDPAVTVFRAGEGRGIEPNKAHIMMSKEQFKGSFDGFRLILIGDLHEQPLLHLRIKPFIVGAKEWSGQLHSTTTMSTQITYWNLLNSHWEPLIDPWTFTITATKDNPTAAMSVSMTARERLDLNISSAFMELGANVFRTWSKEGKHVLQKARGTYAPYRIRNRTGSPIFVWSDTDNAINAKDAEAVKFVNNQIIDWRFDDWKTTREHVSSSQQHNIGIQFVGKPWEQLRSVPVDREGEFTFPLRPITDKYPSKLLCDVKVIDNTKIVTLRSTYKIANYTLYPLELMVVDDAGHPVYSLEKIVPGEDFPLPIEAVTRNRIRIQPDQGFGYKWCPPIRWEDLVVRKSFTIRCPHADPNEAAFRFQAWAQMDTNDSRKYPKINLKLRAPLELENLLPYNLEYRIYDKNTNQNWRSYLRKGGIMPVHSIELGHFVLLNITVQDTVFKPSDFAIINTDGHSDFDVENKLTLRDQLDRKLDLKLNYVRHPESGGAFKLQIYSPYIVMNRTGLPFSIKTTRSSRAGSHDVAGDTRPDVLSSPSPFLLSHSSENGHEYLFKVSDSAWSKLVSVEAPAAETELAIPSERQKADEVIVGLSWSEGLGKYKMTKIITISPRFLIRNLLAEPIAFREHGVAPRERNIINPGQRSPIHVIRSGGKKLLTVAFPGLNAQWSPPINIEDIGVVHFRLRQTRTDGQQQLILLRADVRLQGSSIFIFLSDAGDAWPFEIENDSDYMFKLCQKDTSRELQATDSSSVNYTLGAHSTLQYAWDNPSAYDRKIVLNISQSTRAIDIMEIGNLIPFKFNHNERSKAVSLDVRAVGQKQVLRITNYNPDSSVYKPRQRSNSLSSTRHDTISSNTEAFEAVQEDIAADLIISIEFAGIGMSLINKRLTEVIYVTIGTLRFEYTNSAVAQAINISCGTLQIDNQLHDAVYPVVLQPTPIPKESAGLAALPTVQGSVIWLKDNEHGVLFVKYCSILLQALTLEADEDLLFSLYDLVQVKGISWEDDTEDILIREFDDIPDPAGDAEGQELYFEVLELQPIRLSLSFMRTERVSSEEKLSIRNPLAVVVNALTMTVGNINDASLELNALGIKDVRLTTAELQSRITYHYRQDVLRQLYRILGSADFIGNPVGLFTNVSSGVADIFYEPFQGVVMHGNRELGIGIAKGAASFVKKTVFGVSDSVTKFTSSLGKGLSAATFDSEYQARRRMTQRRNKPRHAIYGVAAGGEAFASSVTSAVEGVLMKPLEGAESEGALGFFKGMGKGLVGAVTKPVVGVFDLASNVSEGIRNTTTVFDSPERDRIRLPRLIPADGTLRSYSAREALGQYWMKDLNNGAYRSESYIAHINSPGGDNVILLTSARVISFWSRKLRLDWELPFSQFTHKAGKENDKFAFIPDKSSQSWFFGQVAIVVKSFNARRRMDS
ncbi:vacuolar protein sorting-associated protein 13 [Cyathus striatus]|nr:vacuolar protein sorting-associated protein 13 [Cyathus striatus]